jgi:hypothetical protein
MRSQVRQGIVAVSALAMFSGGCSFVFGEGPPPDHARLAYFDCVSTYGLPVADALFATSGVLGAADAFSKTKQQYANANNGDSRNTVGGTDIAVAAIYAASTIYGVVQATRCQQAKEALEARIMRPAPVLRPPAFGPAPAAPLPPPVMVPPPAAPVPPPPAPGVEEPTVTPTMPAPTMPAPGPAPVQSAPPVPAPPPPAPAP